MMPLQGRISVQHSLPIGTVCFQETEEFNRNRSESSPDTSTAVPIPQHRCAPEAAKLRGYPGIFAPVGRTTMYMKGLWKLKLEEGRRMTQGSSMVVMVVACLSDKHTQKCRSPLCMGTRDVSPGPSRSKSTCHRQRRKTLDSTRVVWVWWVFLGMGFPSHVQSCLQSADLLQVLRSRHSARLTDRRNAKVFLNLTTSSRRVDT